MVYPKKSLGQNYLTDDNICRNIINSFNAWKRDYVVEIGAGKGAITRILLNKTGNLSAIEIDKNNIQFLKENFEKLEIIEQDILKFNTQNFTKEKEVSKISFIGNIPYNITTPIIFKLIDDRRYINFAHLMIQDEVAKRIVSEPGTKEYGILSIFVQTFADVKLLFKVSRNCFQPKPNVDSRIISMKFNDYRETLIDDLADFKELVKSAFSMRRKTLRNNFKENKFKILLIDNDFDYSRRAETLSVEEYILLSNRFTKLRKLKLN